MAADITLVEAEAELEATAEVEPDPDLTITCGSGNVFADLGFPDAVERQLKVNLALVVNGVTARRRLTRAAMAEQFGVSQTEAFALVRYRLDGFSVEQLMTFLVALGQDVEIIVRTKPRSQPSGRISVKAA